VDRDASEAQGDTGDGGVQRLHVQGNLRQTVSVEADGPQHDEGGVEVPRGVAGEGDTRTDNRGVQETSERRMNDGIL